jgi:hypothetical protein
MRHLLVEIQRHDGWRKLTTFTPVETGRITRERAEELARRDAERSLAGWRDYFGSDAQLRITPVEGW